MEQTIPQILRQVVREYAVAPSQFYKTPDGGWASVSYAEMLERAFDFGAGLMSIGIGRGAHVGLISDNRKEWLQADFGIMLIGAIDVPRGCDAIERDLRFILSVTECTTCVAENSAQFKKIVKFRDELPQLKEMILFDAPQQDDLESARAHNITLYTFDQIIEKGKAFRAAHPGAVEAELDKGRKEDIACIIFTSGTTGEPKGVILTHENFTLQLEELPERITIKPNQSCLSVLPVWHAYERACEYVVMIQGGALAYSKPIGSIMLADFVSINPTLFPAVPRVFEAVYQGVQRAMRKTGGVVYVLFKFFVASGNLHSKIDRRLFRKTARFGNDHIILSWILLFIPWLLLCPVKALGSVIVFKKVRAKLGNRFYGGISGGGALSPDTDSFFWTAGVNVVEGYGITEAAPIISVRPIKRPIYGTVGAVLRGMEARVVDEQGNVLPPGKKGVLHVRGKMVMQGYYKRDDLTQKAIDKEGWFDTGDIAILTVDNEIVLRGRIKDTIVLRGGENIEPLPIEMKLNELPVVARSVVVGQDQRALGALIVPEKDEVLAFADQRGITYSTYEELLGNKVVKDMFNHEIQGAICAKNGFRLFERISQFTLLSEEFQVGKELSAKQDISRYKIAEIYAKEIKVMFKNAG